MDHYDGTLANGVAAKARLVSGERAGAGVASAETLAGWNLYKGESTDRALAVAAVLIGIGASRNNAMKMASDVGMSFTGFQCGDPKPEPLDRRKSPMSGVRSLEEDLKPVVLDRMSTRNIVDPKIVLTAQPYSLIKLYDGASRSPHREPWCQLSFGLKRNEVLVGYARFYVVGTREIEAIEKIAYASVIKLWQPEMDGSNRSNQ